MLSITSLFVILLIVTILCLIMEKNIFAPNVLFCSMWCMSSFLVSRKLYNINDIKDGRTTLIILIGVFSFILGTIFSKMRFRTLNNDNHLNALSSLKLISLSKRNLFWIFTLLLIFDFNDIIRVLNAIRNGISYELLRGAYFGLSYGADYNRDTSVLFTYMSSFIGGFRYIYSALCIMYFTLDTKKNRNCIIYALILLFIRVFISGGRMELMVFGAQVVISFAFYRGRNLKAYINLKRNQFKMIRRQNKIAIVLILFLLSGVIYISKQRGIDMGDAIAKHMYMYFSGGIIIMDKRLSLIDLNGYTYSAAGFYGVWSLILPVFHYIGFDYPVFYLNAVHNIINPLQDIVQVGSNTYMNAFVTTFYHPFADLGWIGLCMALFIWGFINGKCYKNTRNNFACNSTILYLLCIGAMLLGINHYPYVSSAYVVAFISLYFVTTNKFKIKLKKRN